MTRPKYLKNIYTKFHGKKNVNLMVAPEEKSQSYCLYKISKQYIYLVILALMKLFIWQNKTRRGSIRLKTNKSELNPTISHKGLENIPVFESLINLAFQREEINPYLKEVLGNGIVLFGNEGVGGK